nr:copia protein [Tanacetum cinerariifolium]
MSRDVLTVGSTMRIPLLYRGEYSQWVERFMNYLEEQTDGEAMNNSIKNGDQPLPRVTQVSIAGTSSTEQPLFKDKSINKTAKDLWDALARHMFGSGYGEQDRKAAVLYEYETFKATEGELFLNTYIRYIQKHYATMMRQNKNLMDINTDALYNILKKNQRDVNDAIKFYSKPTNNNLRTSSTSQSTNKKQEFFKSDDKKVEKKDDEKKRDISKVKCYNCKKEGHFAKDCKKVKVKDYEYYKTKMKQIANQEVLYDKMIVQLVKLDKHVRDLKNMVLGKDLKISELEEYVRNKDLEIQKCLERLNVSENKLHKMDQTNQSVHMIMPSKDTLYNGKKGIGFENLSYFEKAKCLRPTVYDEKVIGLGYTLMFLTHSDKALEIEKFKRARENKIKFAYDYGCLNASYVNEKINFSDDYFQEIINPNFEKIDYSFQQTSSLKLHVLNVILEKIIIDLEDEVNNLFIFDDESVRISHVSKMTFRKKSCDSMNGRSKSNSNKSLPRTSIGCSKHMTGNRSLLTNFMEKFLGTVRFGNNDFAVIAGYRVMVIGSMTIKKVYYVNGLGHNLFSVGKFCDKGLEVAFRKSTCFVRNEDNVDLLTGDRSSNLYTIALNEVSSNSSTYLLAKASSSQSWLWHQRLSHLNFVIINNLVKNKFVQGLPKMKFKIDHLCSACEQGKIHQKYHTPKTAFGSNKPLYLLHMDLCGPMRVESINGK